MSYFYIFIQADPQIRLFKYISKPQIISEDHVLFEFLQTEVFCIETLLQNRSFLSFKLLVSIRLILGLLNTFFSLRKCLVSNILCQRRKNRPVPPACELRYESRQAHKGARSIFSHRAHRTFCDTCLYFRVFFLCLWNETKCDFCSAFCSLVFRDYNPRST